MGTLLVVLTVLVVGAANSALFIWLARRLERRFLSGVGSASTRAVTAIQEDHASLMVAIEGTRATVLSRWEDLQATLGALCADACTKASPGAASPAVLIPEEHCLDIELKAALASHGIASRQDLEDLVADWRVMGDVMEGRRSARDLVLALQGCSPPMVAKGIFSDIARLVDSLRSETRVQ